MWRKGLAVKRGMQDASKNQPALGGFGSVAENIVNRVLKDPPVSISTVKDAHRKAIIGLLVQVGEQSVVIDSVPGQSLGDFANELAESKIDILDGTLLVEIDGVRKRCFQVGVLEDEEPNPGRLVLPQRFYVPRVETLASKDDSFGKARWRGEMKEFAAEVFTEKKMDPKRDGVALIFGGLGEEIDMWRSFGIEEENIYSIEEDLYIAEEQERRFPKVKIFRHNFEGNIRKFHEFVGKGGKWSTGKDSRVNFTVVNLDPESKMSHKFVTAMRSIRTTGGVYAYNFYMKREGPVIRDFYESVAQHVNDFHYNNGFQADMDFDAIRRKAMESLLDYAKCPRRTSCIVTRPPRRAKKSAYGDYEAAGGGKMMYAMHQI